MRALVAALVSVTVAAGAHAQATRTIKAQAAKKP